MQNDDAAHDASVDQAILLHQSGALTQAETLYRSLLQQDPDDPEVLNFLGLLLQDQGKHQEALDTLLKALDLDPDFPEALTNLARVRHLLGQTEQARQDAAKAVELDPELPEAQLQYGRLLLETKELGPAEAALNACIALDPTIQDAYLFLGLALLAGSRTSEAIGAFQQAARIRPLQPNALIQIGTALREGGQLDQALAYHTQAATSAPSDARAHAALAMTLHRRAEPALAEKACERALAIDPALAEVWHLRATSLSVLGRFDEADVCQQQAIALKPDLAAARRDRTAIGRATDSDLAFLKSQIDDPSATVTDKAASGFALASALDKQGQYDDAFATVAQANHLFHDHIVQAGKGFDPAGFNSMVNQLIQTYTPDVFRTYRDLGNRSELPAFIVGLPRSGTSLVEQIIASHPAVQGGGERLDVWNLIQRLDPGPITNSPARWNPEQVQRDTTGYTEHLAARAPGALRVADKLPDNVVMLGQIAVLFPNARIIFCNRDLRDTCLSIYFQHFRDSTAWAYDLNECAERALQIQRLTDHWRATLPLRMLDIDYEAVVAGLETESRKLCDFLDLPWDPACLRFHETERPVLTASYWQVRQPLFATSVGRWRHYRAQLGPLAVALHPDTDPGPAPALTQAARTALAANQSALAEALLAASLRVDPNQPDALHDEAMCRIVHNNPANAVLDLRRAIALEPDKLTWRIGLARALLASNQLEEAATAARAVIARDPATFEAWMLLGEAYTVLCQWVEAVEAYRQASTLAPDSILARIGHAMALLEWGSLPESQEIWTQAEALDPNNADVCCGLAAIHARHRDEDTAQRYLDRVIALDPNSARLRFRMANIYLWMQKPDKAEEQARAAVALQPGLAPAWTMIGDMCGMLGRVDDALVAYRTALTHDPYNGGALTGLVASDPAADPADIANLARVRAMDETAPISVRVGSAYALTGALQKLKDYDAAFDALALAKRLDRAMRFEPDASRVLTQLRDMFEWTRTHFTEETLLSGPVLGNFSNAPVFVVGMPRSGTSLIEQILASHPSVAGLGETQEIASIVSRDGSMEPPAAWDVAKYQQETDALLNRIQARFPHASRWVDKMPDHITLLGHISMMFPRASVIVCRRDLRDVCWSCMNQNFLESEMIWVDTQEECAARARLIEQFAQYWLQILPTPVIEVQYEDLVADLEGQSRRMIDFIGLPWDPACLDFWKTDRQVRTASALQVRRPVYTSSIGRWRPYRKHLGPLLEGLKGLVPDD